MRRPLSLITQLPRNIWVLAITFSLVMTGISLLLFVGGIIGKSLAPNTNLATLPITAFVIGCAVMAIPSALLLKKLQRKTGSYVGLSLSLLSALFGVTAVNQQSFIWLVLTGFCIGLATPFYQQFRFAVIESLKDSQQMGPALSLLMLFNIGGALLGPEFGAVGQNWVKGAAPFTGSFILFGASIIIAMAVFAFFKNPPEPVQQQISAARSLFEIVKQPVFLVAVAAGALGYAVMSYLMTSTPISMHEHHGHSLADAKWVIQSHLVAMFLPSLFSGFLMQKLGIGKLMFAGSVLYLLVALVAFGGNELLHYWWALVLLGVGWNFLFLSGTSLLPSAYTHTERFKTQATNDFIIFVVQGLASLMAGWIIFNYGWKVQVISIIPFIVVLFVASYFGIRFKK